MLFNLLRIDRYAENATYFVLPLVRQVFIIRSVILADVMLAYKWKLQAFLKTSTQKVAPTFNATRYALRPRIHHIRVERLWMG